MLGYFTTMPRWRKIVITTDPLYQQWWNDAGGDRVSCHMLQTGVPILDQARCSAFSTAAASGGLDARCIDSS